ncbi:hypothetical protein [Nocardia terpenica]|uniref:ABC-2 type transport system permease protein n=1 Tax=Nocardia terpenica TaxID=455432 RepID=A0A6G9YWR0_9NOCA|nr:hypothetical protein [Nocardia terpenica]QIS17541.1 hypothetical protein F6W96_03710 [Nocardia terpenica]
MSTIGIRAAVGAESAVWLRSPLVGVPLAAVGYSLLVTGLQAGTRATTWTGSLAHLNMWVVGVGPLFLAVLAGTQTALDRRARTGGTRYRAVSPETMRGARFAVLAVWCLLAHGITVLTTGVAGVALSGAPVGTVAADGARLLVVLWLSSLGYCAVLVVAGEAFGIAGCVVAGLVFSAVGTVTAESSHWYLVPQAWIVRPALPLIGTHANGVGLAGDRVEYGWVALIFAASSAVVVLLAAPFALAAVATVRTWSLGLRVSAASIRPRHARNRRHDSPIRTLPLIVRRSRVGLLAAAAIGATLVTQWWYGPETAYLCFALLVLPMGCAVLPAVWIPRLRTGFRAIAARPSDPRILITGMAGLLILTELLVCLIVGAGACYFGQSPGSALANAALAATVGAMLVMFGAVVTTVAGRAAGLLVGFVGTTFGTLVGGTGLVGRLGPVVPWCWAVLREPGRAIVVVPLAIALTAAALVLLRRRFARSAAAA